METEKKTSICVECNQEKYECSICGECNDEVFHKLKCRHTFHYNCLYLSFKNMKNLSCPYCRSTNNSLPIISGIKKVIPNIHLGYYNKNKELLETYKNFKIEKCNHILQRGNNKGEVCGKNCKLGYKYCGTHYKKYIKDNEQIVL